MTADQEATAAIEEGNQVAAVRRDQSELYKAFLDKHGIEPDDACVDIRRLPNNRIVWDVRKMSVAEREGQNQLALKREIDALKQATNRTYVYYDASGARWWEKILGKLWPPAVHLTEKGAMQASLRGGMLGKIEVKA